MSSATPDPGRKARSYRTTVILTSTFALLVSIGGLVRAQSAPVDLHMALRLNKPVHGSFVQQRAVAGLDGAFTSSGTFLVVHGKGLLWQVRSPAGFLMAFTPEGTKTWDAAGQPTQADTGMPRQMNRMIQDIMDLSILEDRRFESVVSGDPSAWTLEIVPKRASIKRHLTRARIGGDAFIRSIEIVGGDGSSTHLEFTDLATVDALTLDQCAALGLRATDCPAPAE